MYALLANYGQLVRNRRYFPLWLGQLISNLGDTLHYIALVVWVYQRTGSSLVVAGTVFFEVVPVILLAPVAGVVIDRLPRKAVLIGADLARAAGVAMVCYLGGAMLVFAGLVGIVALRDKRLAPADR